MDMEKRLAAREALPQDAAAADPAGKNRRQRLLQNLLTGGPIVCHTRVNGGLEAFFAAQMKKQEDDRLAEAWEAEVDYWIEEETAEEARERMTPDESAADQEWADRQAKAVY